MLQWPSPVVLPRALAYCEPHITTTKRTTKFGFAELQQSLLTILKESFKVYKAISEGLINLADRFFEMEYHDAHKGLEIYKESIVANDRLQQYYQQIEQIEELRRAIQFPKLESPPADFLTQMEAYAKEAPRPYDESSGAVGGSKKVSRLSKPFLRSCRALFLLACLPYMQCASCICRGFVCSIAGLSGMLAPMDMTHCDMPHRQGHEQHTRVAMSIG